MDYWCRVAGTDIAVAARALEDTKCGVLGDSHSKMLSAFHDHRLARAVFTAIGVLVPNTTALCNTHKCMANAMNPLAKAGKCNNFYRAAIRMRFGSLEFFFAAYMFYAQHLDSLPDLITSGFDDLPPLPFDIWRLLPRELPPTLSHLESLVHSLPFRFFQGPYELPKHALDTGMTREEKRVRLAEITAEADAACQEGLRNATANADEWHEEIMQWERAVHMHYETERRKRLSDAVTELGLDKD